MRSETTNKISFST